MGFLVANYTLIITSNNINMKSSSSLAKPRHFILQHLDGVFAAYENAVYIMKATNLFCLETLSK